MDFSALMSMPLIVRIVVVAMRMIAMRVMPMRRGRLGAAMGTMRAAQQMQRQQQQQRQRQGLNENYGRELLELHSVGVDAGYSEQEMYDSTLVMTGFGIDWDSQLFRYSSDDHHTGRVKVLGWSSKNTNANGHAMGLGYIRYLAHHPSTARRIADKLVARFVSDTPQPGLANELAHTYLANDTAIVPVLRKLFRSKTFAASIVTSRVSYSASRPR